MPEQAGAKRRGRPPGAAAGAPSKAARLREAGLSAFATYGFEGASLRQIAAAADVDSALIKHHFGSKLGLWQAAVDEIADRLGAAIDTTVASGDAGQDSAAQFAEILSRVVDIVCDMPFLAPFILREISEQGERFGYLYDRLIHPLRDLLVPMVETANAEGALPGLDPDLLYAASFGAITTAVMARSYLAHTSAAARDEQRFRAELKRIAQVMVARAAPQPGSRGDHRDGTDRSAINGMA